MEENLPFPFPSSCHLHLEAEADSGHVCSIRRLAGDKEGGILEARQSREDSRERKGPQNILYEPFGLLLS